MRPLELKTRHHERAAGANVAFVSVPKIGELANGDRGLFRWNDAGHVLLAIVDGLGHGPGAAEVSTMTINGLQSLPLESSILQMMESLHQTLRGTRGVAATLCKLSARRLEACAVGNVELRSSDMTLPFMFSPGILGVRVQKFRICEAALKSPCRIVMFSDGISTRVRLDDVRNMPPEEASSTLLERHRRNEDDATVLIADVE